MAASPTLMASLPSVSLGDSPVILTLASYWDAWQVMEMLEDSLTPPEEAIFKTGVSAMYPSDADGGRLFFQGAGKTHWVTYDKGKSFIKRAVDKPLSRPLLPRHRPPLFKLAAARPMDRQRLTCLSGRRAQLESRCTRLTPTTCSPHASPTRSVPALWLGPFGA